MPFGHLTEEMLEVLAAVVRDQEVYDLGAGDLGHAYRLVRLRASKVVAIDKERLPVPRSPKILTVQSYLNRVPVPDRYDVAFLAWPQNCPLVGLTDWLHAADMVVYLGSNRNGSSCGNPQLFHYLAHRELLAEVEHHRNTLLVLGSWRESPRPMTGEEAAHFSAEVVDFHR
jgi:hypothetical protein